MTSTRDRMLGAIRGALGSGSTEDLPPPLRAGLSGGASFAESLAALGGIVFEVDSLDTATAKVREIVGGRSYAASPAARGWGFRDTTEIALAEFGISTADYLLADTGSIVFLSESGESRLISLLPPRHIVVIARDRILSGLEELFERVPQPATRSSSMVLITGPSRTADIEMRLVRGVHGPGEVTVIIVNNV